MDRRDPYIEVDFETAEIGNAKQPLHDTQPFG